MGPLPPRGGGVEVAARPSSPIEAAASVIDALPLHGNALVCDGSSDVGAAVDDTPVVSPAGCFTEGRQGVSSAVVYLPLDSALCPAARDPGAGSPHALTISDSSPSAEPARMLDSGSRRWRLRRPAR
ncbi:protein of unknown function [Blastococcus saxobsidens DD2]|uniref:Uncharacterized protein n=1 Tax=Blastococcus saxobsidens (strain DD2) TaxID=1146883 RepID=H6RJK6_BLASD|nr:protein of unknown function [Blastococcus saxobsidens DD2]